jgi:hypothetical protein
VDQVRQSKRDGLRQERDGAGGGPSGRSHPLSNHALQIHFVFNEIDSLEDGFTANRESTDCVRDVTKHPLSRFLSRFFIVISFLFFLVLSQPPSHPLLLTCLINYIWPW